jgi:hypothetical protein
MGGNNSSKADCHFRTASFLVEWQPMKNAGMMIRHCATRGYY